MKIKYAILSVLLLFGYKMVAQPAGYTKDIIKKGKIKNIIGIMRMENSDFDGLKLKEYYFDSLGRCVRQEIMSPFMDVVTSSSGRQFYYDSLGNIIKKISTGRRVGITEKDKSFIAMFGANESAMIVESFYAKGLLRKKIKYRASKEDTLVISYLYEDSLLVKNKYFSTKNPNALSRANYEIRYFYDDLSRLIKKEKQYKTTALFSTTTISYVGGSDKKDTTHVFNAFKWVTKRDDWGGIERKIIQDALYGKIEVNVYNNAGKLIEERYYPNLADLSQVRVVEIGDKGNRKITEKGFKKDEVSFYLKDKKEKIFDGNGLLKEIKVMRDGKLKYTCEFMVNYKEE